MERNYNDSGRDGFQTNIRDNTGNQNQNQRKYKGERESQIRRSTHTKKSNKLRKEQNYDVAKNDSSKVSGVGFMMAFISL